MASTLGYYSSLISHQNRLCEVNKWADYGDSVALERVIGEGGLCGTANQERLDVYISSTLLGG